MDAIFYAGPEYQQNIERSHGNYDQNRRMEPSPYRHVGEAAGDYSFQPATEKQKNYLRKLLSDSGNDYEPDEISALSKSDAAERIGFLVEASGSKINY